MTDIILFLNSLTCGKICLLTYKIDNTFMSVG